VAVLLSSRAMRAPTLLAPSRSREVLLMQVVAIKIITLGPRGHKVFHKRLLRVGTHNFFR